MHYIALHCDFYRSIRLNTAFQHQNPKAITSDIVAVIIVNIHLFWRQSKISLVKVLQFFLKCQNPSCIWQPVCLSEPKEYLLWQKGWSMGPTRIKCVLHLGRAKKLTKGIYLASCFIYIENRVQRIKNINFGADIFVNRLHPLDF